MVSKEDTWSLHLKAQVPLPMSKASGHSHMRQLEPNWSHTPLPGCGAVGGLHCPFCACPSRTCRQVQKSMKWKMVHRVEGTGQEHDMRLQIMNLRHKRKWC